MLDIRPRFQPQNVLVVRSTKEIPMTTYYLGLNVLSMRR